MLDKILDRYFLRKIEQTLKEKIVPIYNLDITFKEEKEYIKILLKPKKCNEYTEIYCINRKNLWYYFIQIDILNSTIDGIVKDFNERNLWYL